MADRQDLDFTYSLTDRIFRLSMGELADFSGAKYDGDFTLTLEEAQRRKHEYVAEQVGMGSDRRLLDLGCGWGALLDFVRHRGGLGVGVTLSAAQLAACRRHGLDVHLRDARQVDRATFGPFDAVASLGAFEHFCSPDEFRGGRQEVIYRRLFARVASVLPEHHRAVERTHPSAEREKGVAQASPRSPVADKRRFPARVHLRRERQQGLFRTGASRPLPTRIREARGD